MKKLILLIVNVIPVLMFADISDQKINQKNNPLIFIEGDILYWKIEESGLDFMTENAITIGENHGAGGDYIRARYDWDAGFRVSMTGRVGEDKWDIKGQYGYFSADGTREYNRAENHTIQATFPQQIANLQKATSQISLRCHFGDLLLQKLFYSSPRTKMNFINGMTMVWMKQRWAVVYNNNTTTQCQVKPKWNFKGGGIKLGLNVDWILGHGFNWSSKGTISELWGNYDNRMRVFTEGNGNVITQYEDSHLDEFRLATNIDFQMGPSWEKNFKNWGLKLLLSYETNIWFNVQQINRTQYSDSTSNISTPQSRPVMALLQMQGLTAFLRLNY